MKPCRDSKLRIIFHNLFSDFNIFERQHVMILFIGSHMLKHLTHKFVFSLYHRETKQGSVEQNRISLRVPQRCKFARM